MSLLNAARLCLNGSMLVREQRKLFSVACHRLSSSTDLKFTEKHEWIKMNGNVGTVGITDYAQDKLGEVVYIELPEVGAVFKQSDQFSTLESVKAVSECYLPAGGKITEINEALKENPSHINKSPFGEGWLVKIEVEQQQELGKLMNESQYKEFLKSDQH